MGQLGKIEYSVQARRQRAAQLSEEIGGVPGVAAPFVPENTRHSYWLYMLRIPENARRFGEALVAEGVPAWVNYIQDPLYLSPLFTEPATYGTSGYPLRPFGRQEYRHGLCPNAEKALGEVIAILWNENYTIAHVHLIAEAIGKCAAAL